MDQRDVVGIDGGAALDELQRRQRGVVGGRLVEVAFVDVGRERGALCGAGRADGMRTTDARFLTGRRSVGRTTGLGATTFFLAAGLRTAGFFALAALRVGFFPLPDPVFDLPLAMLASRARFPLLGAAHFHTKGRVFTSFSLAHGRGQAATIGP